MTEQHPSEKSIFLSAIEIGSATDRAAYLDKACAGNEPLRAEIAALVEAHEKPQPLMDAPAASPPTMEAPLSERPGMIIGPYKLLQQIGEGGMGVVWMAEQTQPVQRKVALKVIKPGMDSRQVIARFEAERQALAMMDHVNIARVFDGGSTGDSFSAFSAPLRETQAESHAEAQRTQRATLAGSGRPYFVMELVHGIPITKYCDDNHLTPRERLELFVPVCQAIQHAHQKGIIHRDIKPSNVMVTLYDGKPVPKVIDFGVAKATEQKLTERTLFTQYGTMVGTLEYMSPEQAETSALGVDTRSDIYSLGVLLYELLTGSTPLTHKRMKEAAYAEILRMIKEEEPPKPSTRLSDSGEALVSISANRQTEPAKLTKLVRGELDWIVMKCLEKDRNRRYETASGFAADVQRYLTDEPVQACPPSATYKVKKFLRRNKGPVAAAALVFVALLAGVVVSAWQAARATTAEATARSAEEQANDDRDNALKAEAEAKVQRDNAAKAEAEAKVQRDKAVAAEKQALAEKKRADEEAAVAKAVSEFLQNDLLAEAAPEKNARNKKVTVEEVLGRAASRIAGKFEKQPRIEAAIRQTIGTTYQAIGDSPAAQPHLERALEVRRRVLGEEDQHTLSSMNSLAIMYQDRGQFPKAEPLFVKALEVGRRVLGEEHPDTLSFMSNLAGLYLAQGQYPKAEPLCVKVLEVRRRLLGEEHPETLGAMDNLAVLYLYQGQYPKAEPLLVKALEVQRRVLGKEHSSTLSSMGTLAKLYWAQGQYPKAEPLLLKVLEFHLRVRGEEHYRTLAVMNNLALLYMNQRQYAKAEPLLLKVLEVQRRVLGEEHPDTLMSMNNLAVLYRNQRQYAKAEPLCVKALEICRRVLGAEHPHTLITMCNLAQLYLDQGQFPQAEPLFVKSLEVGRRVLGEEHPLTLATMHDLAGLYLLQGQFLKAEPLYVKVLEVRRRLLGEEHPETLDTMNNLAVLYVEQGQFAKAELLCRELLEKTRKRHGKASLPAAGALSPLGLNLLKQERYADAEPLLRECLEIREQKEPDAWTTFNTKSMLGGSLLGQKKYADAEPLLVQGYEGMKQREAKIPAAGKVRLTEALERLVQLYEARDNPDEAARWRTELAARKAPPKEEKKPPPKK